MKQSMLVIFAVFMFSCSSHDYECYLQDKQVVIEQTDTAKNHVLIFVGGKQQSKALVIYKNTVIADLSFNNHDASDMATNFEMVKVIIYGNNQSFDTILNLKNYKKFILIAKLDSSVLLQHTDDSRQILIR